MIEFSAATSHQNIQVDRGVKDPTVRCLTMQGSTEMINNDAVKTTT